MGAVPSFCDANHRSFIVCKYLGQPPVNLGTVPNGASLSKIVVNLGHSAYFNTTENES